MNCPSCERICDQDTIKKALEQQCHLKDQGIFKPLGSIIIEDIGVAITDLDRVLARMHVDVLSTATTFTDIPHQSLIKTVSMAEQLVLPTVSIFQPAFSLECISEEFPLHSILLIHIIRNSSCQTLLCLPTDIHKDK